MAEAFDLAFKEAQSWNKAMNEVKSELGKEKIEYSENKVDPELVSRFDNEYRNELKEAILDDENRNLRIEEIHNKVVALFEEDEEITKGDINSALAKVEKKITRELILQGKRPSGRELDEKRKF